MCGGADRDRRELPRLDHGQGGWRREEKQGPRQWTAAVSVASGVGSWRALFRAAARAARRFALAFSSRACRYFSLSFLGSSLCFSAQNIPKRGAATFLQLGK